jgi:hypothetical protein
MCVTARSGKGEGQWHQSTYGEIFYGNDENTVHCGLAYFTDVGARSLVAEGCGSSGVEAK